MHQVYNWNYFGLKIKFKSNNVLFLDLIKNKFSSFNTTKTFQFEKRSINISFIESSSFNEHKLATILSSNAAKTKNVLYLDHKYLTTSSQIIIKFKKNDILNINIYFNNSFIFKIANFILGGLLKRQLFQNIIKLYVEQSLLWNLSIKHKLDCIHASSIEKDNEVTIFAGLNGVGKSTLALFLAVKKEYKLFSDNYLLIDRNYAYLFPDNIRLTKKSINSLNLKSSESFGFNKYLLTKNQVEFSKEIRSKIKEIHIVYRGKKWSKKKLKKSEATKMIQSLQISNQESVLFSPVSQYIPRKSIRSISSLKYKYYELTIGVLKEMPYEI
jgi:hypothetical protein